MKCGFRKDHGKVIEKTLSGEIRFLRSRAVLGIVPSGGVEVSIGRTLKVAFSLAS